MIPLWIMTAQVVPAAAVVGLLPRTRHATQRVALVLKQLQQHDLLSSWHARAP